jgi:hypothetical protein
MVNELEFFLNEHYKAISIETTPTEQPVQKLKIKNEKIYEGERKVRYLFQKAQNSNKDKLIIVFSAFSPTGMPPAFNYIRTLTGFDCNKLFILDDFGVRGSYYLSLGNDSSIENSVMQLINKVLKEQGIQKNNVITTGSSKGGFAALYYCIKYKFGHVIAGSPQVFIVDYLKSAKAFDVLDFLLNKTNEDDLNNKLINEVLNTQSFPKVYIHLGEREEHYFNHVKPLIKYLEEKEVQYTLDLGDYDSHADVKFYFPDFLKNTISKILELSWIKNIDVNLKEDTFFVTVEAVGESLEYAWYIYKEDTIIEKYPYSDSNILKWKPNNKGTYKLTAFIKDKYDRRFFNSTDKIIIE